MRAAIYARVSTERQEREQTVASQVAALTAWVRAQGYALTDEHVYGHCHINTVDAGRPWPGDVSDGIRSAVTTRRAP
jgi:site-specific DNA recombinase